eukprot:gnl/TRDRNA2_/TRDRNA2_90956_c0_seq1.p1 gnl/TRDRNA2_/TRDRNA2_90956_c0~~gnl/TRDRNA2_/TRDRNA2_90956_c0_seq1.p1  ORF type:complete len:422 (+),score=44.21 gnl/TRDRNA2_/TRDRNA2_90956_c0_seq1:64-1266(+)
MGASPPSSLTALYRPRGTTPPPHQQQQPTCPRSHVGAIVPATTSAAAMPTNSSGLFDIGKEPTSTNPSSASCQQPDILETASTTTAVACRFCLEETAPPGTPADDARLVSPCACRGTSALVHVGCLRRWQATLMGRRLTPEILARAAACPVCQQPLMVDGQALQPVVSDVVHSVHPGTLLVATEALSGEGRTFHHSVILMCEVEGAGRIRGVDLSRVISPGDILTEAVHAVSSEMEVRVHSGGPVCGGRLGVTQYIVLSTFRELGRSTMVLPPTAAGAPGVFSPSRWIGLEVDKAAETVRKAAPTAVREANGSPGQRQKLLLFKGHCAWGRGQLEGEIHKGNWATCVATAADIFETPPEELWHRLRASRGRLVSVGQPAAAADGVTVSPSQGALAWMRRI